MNAELILCLSDLHKHYHGAKDIFRAKAYAKAIQTIKSLKTKITSGKEAQKYNGIGTSIAAKIDEFIETGKISKIAELKTQSHPVDEDKNNEDREEDNARDVLKLFQQIHGVGPVTAKKWYNHGYRTLEDLVGIKMTSAQKLGYKYLMDIQLRIPRSEIEAFETEFRKIWPADVQFLICGSYRRGAETCGDIDCLIRENENYTLAELAQMLKQRFQCESLLCGQHKFSGLCRYSKEQDEQVTPMRRLDLMIINDSSWPYATLYFTGSYQLNILMRDKAQQFGWTLNEYGITSHNKNDDHEQFNVTTEEEIFKLLDMVYLEPKDRSIE